MREQNLGFCVNVAMRDDLKIKFQLHYNSRVALSIVLSCPIHHQTIICSCYGRRVLSHRVYSITPCSYSHASQSIAPSLPLHLYPYLAFTLNALSSAAL